MSNDAESSSDKDALVDLVCKDITVTEAGSLQWPVAGKINFGFALLREEVISFISSRDAFPPHIIQDILTAAVLHTRRSETFTYTNFAETAKKLIRERVPETRHEYVFYCPFSFRLSHDEADRSLQFLGYDFTLLARADDRVSTRPASQAFNQLYKKLPTSYLAQCSWLLARVRNVDVAFSLHQTALAVQRLRAVITFFLDSGKYYVVPRSYHHLGSLSPPPFFLAGESAADTQWAYTTDYPTDAYALIDAPRNWEALNSFVIDVDPARHESDLYAEVILPCLEAYQRALDAQNLDDCLFCFWQCCEIGTMCNRKERSATEAISRAIRLGDGTWPEFLKRSLRLVAEYRHARVHAGSDVNADLRLVNIAKEFAGFVITRLLELGKRGFTRQVLEQWFVHQTLKDSHLVHILKALEYIREDRDGARTPRQ